MSDGGNGVYRYGATGGFPTDSWNGTNYWVDAVFHPSIPADTKRADRRVDLAGAHRDRRPGGREGQGHLQRGDRPADGQQRLRSRSPTAPTRSPPPSTYNAATRTATLTPTAPLQLRQDLHRDGQERQRRPGRRRRQPVRRGAHVELHHRAPVPVHDPRRHRAGERQRRPGPAARARHQVPPDRGRLHHRPAFLQAVQQQRHPRRPPVDGERPAAGHRDLHRTRPPRAGSRPTSPNPVAVTKDTTYVVLLLLAQRLLRLRAGALRTRRSTTRRCSRLANAATAATASTSTAPARSRPRAGTATNYWVDASFDRTIPPDTEGPTVVATDPASDGSDVARTAARRGRVRRAAECRDRHRRRPSSCVTAPTRSCRAPSRYDAQTRTAKLHAGRAAGLRRRPTPRRSRAAPRGVKDVSDNPLAADKTWSLHDRRQDAGGGPGRPDPARQRRRLTRSAPTTPRSCARRA